MEVARLLLCITECKPKNDKWKRPGNEAATLTLAESIMQYNTADLGKFVSAFTSLLP